MTTTHLYPDPQGRSEAALVELSKLLQDFERNAAQVVGSHYRQINDYVTPGAVLGLMETVIQGMQEDAASEAHRAPSGHDVIDAPPASTVHPSAGYDLGFDHREATR